MPTVRFPRHLIHQFPVPPECHAAGATVGELIDDLQRQFPGVKDYLVDEQGSLRQHVNIFIGERWLADRKTLSDRIVNDDEISVMQALSGG